MTDPLLSQNKHELVARVRALEEALRQEMVGPRRPERQAIFEGGNELLKAVLETAVEGIVTIDAEGMILSVNRAATLIFGYAERELIGHNVSLLMPSPHRENHPQYIRNYLDSGQPKVIGLGREVEGLRSDGTTFPMELSISEVDDPSGKVFTGIIRNISERKRLEQEVLDISERERRRIGQDLHDDLGQKLAGVEFMSQALEKRLSDQGRKESSMAGEIASLVRNAIAQTRALARGLSPVMLDSEGLAEALSELAETTRRHFDVSCHLEVSPNASVTHQATVTHLFRIAQESVHNAIRHGHATEIRIHLAPCREDAFLLSVSDNGSGQAHPLSSFESQAGMGLRIMRYRADLIGATLSLHFKEGKGVEVRCQFPSSPHA